MVKPPDKAILRCAAIVLAAGASSRLGQPKQLISINGQTLLRRTVKLAIEAGCALVFVVLGDDAARFAPELEGLAASAVINKDWQTGMASSLKAGLNAALVAYPALENVMVLVCDQPRLDAPILRALLAAHAAQQPWITASRYQATLGVPAIFSRAVFTELLQLTGDQGARRIVQRHLENVASVDFPGGDLDLDTPEDLAQLYL